MTDRKLIPVFPVLSERYKKSGWHLAPGMCYTSTIFDGNEDSLLVYSNKDTAICALFKPKGQVSKFFEIGRYTMLKYGIFRYLDYGLMYKRTRGKGSFNAHVIEKSTLTEIDTISGKWEFEENLITVNFNANNIIQITDNMFFQNSVGINGEYRFLKRDKYEGDSTIFNPTQPPDIIAQIHYKLGFGFKYNDKILFIPSIEIPILNLYPYDKEKSSLNYFHSKYRPILITFRIFFFEGKGY